MTLPTRLLHAFAAALLLLLAATLPATAGERAPVPPQPLPLQTEPARAIVKFKDDATWRTRIQAADSGSDRRMSAAAVAQLLQERAGTLGQRRGLTLEAGHAIESRTQVVKARGMNSEQLAARLAADPQVEYAVPDYRRRALRVPNDPLYAPSPVPVNGPAVGQWYLKPPAAARLSSGEEPIASINAQDAWTITTGSPSVIVAVVDTGVRPDHPDLAGKLLPGFDFVGADISNDGDGPDADPSDPGDWVSNADKATDLYKDCDVANSSWHGTQVSGLIGAATDNGIGMAGAGWATRILPVRVLGKCFGYDSDIVTGMRWAAGLSVPGVPLNPNKASVVNLSLGGEGSCTATYTSAINELKTAGVVVVAAAGNTTGRAVNNPANCTGVIGVAAIRHVGTKVGFSDLGPQIAIAAPGGNCVNTGASDPCLFPLLTTVNAGSTTPGTNTFSDAFRISVGTSFSAPLVSATAALMLAANPALTPAQIKQIMMDTARVFPFRGAANDADSGGVIQQCHAPNGTDQLQCYCTTATCGAGMLDASRAVAAAAFAAPRALISVSSGQTVVNQPFTLSADTSTASSGRSVSSFEWSIVDNGGILVNPPAGTVTGNTLTLTASAVGQFSVRLVAIDSTGVRGTHEQAFTVTAAPVTPPSTGGGGGGGGAMSAAWLAALAAVVWLSRPRRRP
jgi:serine protease